jgi:hypothetical protein
MKKKLYLFTTIIASAAVLSLSSCLKDSRYVSFANGGTVVDFPLGGKSNFGKDAITEAPDTDANGTIVRQFAVNVASPDLPKAATTIKLAIDNSIVDAYNASQSAVHYLPLPTDAYVFTATTVTVPAGQQYATVSVTFYKNKIDPTNSYMLPIKIASTSNGIISGNFGIHYYHFIGNDFAGPSLWDYTRTPPSGNFVGGSTTIYPVTPTQFEVASGYYTGNIRYEVTFTKNADGTYQDFAVDLNADDITNILGPAGIAVTVHPAFSPASGYTPGTKYTKTQVQHGLLDFIYKVHSSADRTVEDKYYQP